MLTHKQVWNAIDTIAERYGYSASGLAKKSGLDPTSFNPSKRNGPDGRPRWPTMESISRLLQASGASMEEFADLLIGLYTPQSGRVLIDGVDLRHWQLSSWQQRLGVVSQDTFLFNASVADNIRAGRPGIGLGALEAAAARAQILELIQQLRSSQQLLAQPLQRSVVQRNALHTAPQQLRRHRRHQLQHRLQADRTEGHWCDHDAVQIWLLQGSEVNQLAFRPTLQPGNACQGAWVCVEGGHNQERGPLCCCGVAHRQLWAFASWGS